MIYFSKKVKLGVDIKRGTECCSFVEISTTGFHKVGRGGFSCVMMLS